MCSPPLHPPALPSHPNLPRDPRPTPITGHARAEKQNGFRGVILSPIYSEGRWGSCGGGKPLQMSFPPRRPRRPRWMTETRRIPPPPLRGPARPARGSTPRNTSPSTRDRIPSQLGRAVPFRGKLSAVRSAPPRLGPPRPGPPGMPGSSSFVEAGYSPHLGEVPGRPGQRRKPAENHH